MQQAGPTFKDVAEEYAQLGDEEMQRLRTLGRLLTLSHRVKKKTRMQQSGADKARAAFHAKLSQQVGQEQSKAAHVAFAPLVDAILLARKSRQHEKKQQQFESEVRSKELRAFSADPPPECAQFLQMTGVEAFKPFLKACPAPVETYEFALPDPLHVVPELLRTTTWKRCPDLSASIPSNPVRFCLFFSRSEIFWRPSVLKVAAHSEGRHYNLQCCMKC